jgi:hypothetical protein
MVEKEICVNTNTAISTNVSVEIRSNVIQFPLKNRTNFTQDDLEEMREQALLNKIEFVEFVTDELMEELFFKVGMLGFNFEDQDFGKDVGLVIESLRSLILKSMGISHALQQAAEQLIDFSELDEEFEE